MHHYVDIAPGNFYNNSRTMKWAQEEAEPSENENDRQWANCETLKAIKLTRRAFSTRIDQVRC